MSKNSRLRAAIRNRSAMRQQREAAARAVSDAEVAASIELAEAGADRMDCSTYRPTPGTVFVHWPRAAQKVGSILLPETAQEQNQMLVRPARGVVLAVGPDWVCQETGHTIPMPCKVGDEVIFGQRAAVPYEQDGKEVWMMSQMNLYAVVSPVAQVLQ